MFLMSDLPLWVNRKGQQQNATSRKQERNIAKERGGKVQPGSGSSWRAKEDVQTPDSLIQIKYRQKSYSLTAEEGRMLMRNALQVGREPEMIIEFPASKLRAIVRFERI